MLESPGLAAMTLFAVELRFHNVHDIHLVDIVHNIPAIRIIKFVSNSDDQLIINCLKMTTYSLYSNDVRFTGAGTGLP